jgi:hypothetical protein
MLYWNTHAKIGNTINITIGAKHLLLELLPLQLKLQLQRVAGLFVVIISE